jgi:hypothetical protein
MQEPAAGYLEEPVLRLYGSSKAIALRATCLSLFV